MKSILIIVIVSLIGISGAIFTVDAAVIRIPSQQPNIQSGLDVAQDGDTVWVANGTYQGEGNKHLDFHGKRIILRSEGPQESCIIDLQNDGRAFMFRNQESSDAVIDGFTIKNGNVNDKNGGAILCENASPSIINCIITLNSAYYGSGIYLNHSSAIIKKCDIISNGHNVEWMNNGAGIYCLASSPTISHCRISENQANNAGGAVYCLGQSSPVITDSVIGNNRAESNGAGIYLAEGSSPVITNCSIHENLVDGFIDRRGGAIFCTDSSPRLTCCQVTDNFADYGGGIYYYGDSHPIITNCLITGNNAHQGGGLYCAISALEMTNCTFSNNISIQGGAIYATINCSIDILYSIFWGDTPGEIFIEDTSTVSLSYCDILGGFDGTGNIDLDPLFSSSDEGEYFLSHRDAGDPSDSPCVNRANILSLERCFDLYDWPICMDEFTTRTDLRSDDTLLDLGYHHTRYPECSELGCTIIMPSHDFASGDECFCSVTVCNPAPVQYTQIPLFVIIQLLDQFYFAPAFSDFDYYSIDISYGLQEIMVLPSFIWPRTSKPMSDITWYAALTNHDITELLGEMGTFTFGWH